MISLTPQEFVAKWRGVTLKERSASQEHFIDLGRMLGHPTPTEAVSTGEWYTFEAGVDKQAGGSGWADVWKKGYFAWRYKGGQAVFAAYGWPTNLSNEEILERLLTLDLEWTAG